MLTKEECLKALESFKPMNIDEYFKGNYPSYIEANAILEQLIEEHFTSSKLELNSEITRDNTPLKLKEIKEGMWIWDTITKEWIQVREKSAIGLLTRRIGIEYDVSTNYNSDRFYRKEVTDSGGNENE